MKTLDIKLLRQEDGAALVEYEYQNKCSRVVISPEDIEDGKCSLETLQNGTEFGVNWIEIIGEIDTTIAKDFLNSRNIWTWEDLEKNPLYIRKALQACIEPIVKKIVKQLRS